MYMIHMDMQSHLLENDDVCGHVDSNKQGSMDENFMDVNMVNSLSLSKHTSRDTLE